MPFDLAPDALANVRDAHLGGRAGALYGHLGAFTYWFSIVELNVTMALAHALRFRDFGRFEYLVRGMDAKTKVERLFGADPKFQRLGPNLVVRLDRFKSISVTIRNHIAHSWPHLEPNDYIYFLSVGAFSLEPAEHEVAIKESPHISLDEMTRETMWLQILSYDLQYPNLTLEEALEIVSPKSGLPKAGHPHPLRRAPRAKRRKREQKPPETRA